MGMYDTIRFLDDAPRCAEGHAVREVQTKDLECDDTHYEVFEGRLFVPLERGEPEPSLDGDHLVLTRRDRLRVYGTTAELQVYGTCPTCRPVLAFEETAIRDAVREHRAFHDWAVLVEAGRVRSIRLMSGRTREELRAELVAKGVEVLDDGDRLARRHIALRAEGRRDW